MPNPAADETYLGEDKSNVNEDLQEKFADLDSLFPPDSDFRASFKAYRSYLASAFTLFQTVEPPGNPMHVVRGALDICHLLTSGLVAWIKVFWGLDPAERTAEFLRNSAWLCPAALKLAWTEARRGWGYVG